MKAISPISLLVSVDVANTVLSSNIQHLDNIYISTYVSILFISILR